jgi:hypothetical protein
MYGTKVKDLLATTRVYQICWQQRGFARFIGFAKVYCYL